MDIISVGKRFIQRNYSNLYYLYRSIFNLIDFHTNVGWLFMNILKTDSESNGRHTFLKTTPLIKVTRCQTADQYNLLSSFHFTMTNGQLVA